jgi:phytoene synthase
MDLKPQRFQSWDDLSDYIWKVACSVGLVSIRLFGCQSEQSKDYALALGNALQLTNILREVGEDIANGRIYLPLDDLERFGITEYDLSHKVHDDKFLQLMTFEADRAQQFFDEADKLITETDHHALRPARIMSAIYQQLLRQMRDDKFQVLSKRYRVSKARKMAILTKHMLAG